LIHRLLERVAITSKEENVAHPENYDVVVLGSGAAGKLLAWALASRGKRTAVIERRYIGGACPKIACLPSKNVIHGAKVASYFRRATEFGIANGDWKVDMAAVHDRKRKMVDGLVALHLEKYRDSGGRGKRGHSEYRHS
jgi:pyruvate/2-oxoglutarate dehydrogenase complex dihydrolipoamide dehydrogenase (E3) component